MSKAHYFLSILAHVDILRRYYGGVGIVVSREEDLRRERAREREECDKMVGPCPNSVKDFQMLEKEVSLYSLAVQVRDYVRSGRGWSQPDVARRREEVEDRRKLPR